MAHDLPNHHFPGDRQIRLTAAAVVDRLQGDLGAPPPRTVDAALHKESSALGLSTRFRDALERPANAHGGRCPARRKGCIRLEH